MNPTVFDSERGLRGEVTQADSTRISVVWDDGFTTTYWAEKVLRNVAAGRWTFSIPETVA